MRILLDVGAHRGETLAEVVKPAWGFERIYCFEPASSCRDDLLRFADDRTEILPFGLWTEDTELTLHDPGAIGASIHAGKALGGEVERCAFADATRWFADHVNGDDAVFMKVNCEGAECDLLDHLLDSGELSKVDHLLVHFDVLKVPGMGHRAAETKARLVEAGISYTEASSIMFGRSHAAKTANWLAWCEAGQVARLRYSLLNRIEFRFRQRLYPLKVRLSGSR